MSGKSLGSQKQNMCLGAKNKCQETRRALKQPVQEFCAPKANVGAVKKNMSLGHQKQMSGNPLGSQKSMRFGHQNKCQETFWALKEHELWAPKTKVRKLAGLSKSMSFGTKKQMSANPPGSLKQYMNLGTKTNVRKPSGLSKKISFAHQQQMSGNSLGSQKKPCVLGAKNKCQETRRALKQPVQKFCAPKANVGAVKKDMSLGHQKQRSGNPWGSQKSMSFGHQNKRQQTFWALQNYILGTFQKA